MRTQKEKNERRKNWRLLESPGLIYSQKEKDKFVLVTDLK